jgi:transcriptional regulator with XRE-family HTH domain
MHKRFRNGMIRRVPKADALESDEAIAARIVLLREALGYENAADFARRLGITQQRLSNWENNRPALPHQGARMIRRVTGATLDWLYFGVENGLPRDVAEALQSRRRERARA